MATMSPRYPFTMTVAGPAGDVSAFCGQAQAVGRAEPGRRPPYRMGPMTQASHGTVRAWLTGTSPTWADSPLRLLVRDSALDVALLIGTTADVHGADVSSGGPFHASGTQVLLVPAGSEGPWAWHVHAGRAPVAYNSAAEFTSAWTSTRHVGHMRDLTLILPVAAVGPTSSAGDGREYAGGAHQQACAGGAWRSFSSEDVIAYLTPTPPTVLTYLEHHPGTLSNGALHVFDLWPTPAVLCSAADQLAATGAPVHPATVLRAAVVATTRRHLTAHEVTLLDSLAPQGDAMAIARALATVSADRSPYAIRPDELATLLMACAATTAAPRR